MSDATTFHFIGGPLDELDGSAPLFEAIGFSSASWSRLETQIDVLIVHINSPIHSKKLYAADHPVSFTKKVDLLKRWFNQHPPLAPYRDKMREIRSELRILGSERNTFIHAIFEAWNAETQTALVHTFKYEGNDRFTATKREITLGGFVDFSVAVNHTNKELWKISSDLFTEDGLRRLETP